MMKYGVTRPVAIRAINPQAALLASFRSEYETLKKANNRFRKLHERGGVADTFEALEFLEVLEDPELLEDQEPLKEMLKAIDEVLRTRAKRK